MEKEKLLQALKEARSSKKRKFKQTVDLIINLKGIDIKKESGKISTFFALPNGRGKNINVTALVGKELSTKAKDACHKTILLEDFKGIAKKEIKALVDESDYFIAQANIMPQVAATFGRVLGPRGLMPNPKAGCILAPTEEVKPEVERLQSTVKIETKNEPTIKVPIGTEDMKDEEIAENAMAVYNNVLQLLPQEKANIKSILIKLTMGKPVIAYSETASKRDK